VNQKTNGFAEFLRAAIKDPKNVSTIFPTMAYLSQSLVRFGRVQSDSAVLELGSGSGAITSYILKQKPAHFIGIELDQNLVNYLKKTFPDASFVKASADNLEDHVANQSIDVVISSLPWTLFNYKLQEAITQEVLRVLKPGGLFLTFICLHSLAYPGAKRMRALFQEKFQHFEKKQTVLRNIPPANIYLATKGI